MLCYADADGRELLDEELPLRQAIESQHAAARNVKILNAAGNWIDAPSATQTETDIENAILTRARQLRLSNIKG